MSYSVTLEEKIAYAECYDILMFLKSDEFNKIPQKLMKFLKVNRQLDFISSVNPYVSLEYQKVSTKAKNIITCIYREYLADEDEKQWFKEKDEKEFEELNRKLTDEDYKAMFDNVKENSNAAEVQNEEDLDKSSVPLSKPVEKYACNLPVKKMNFFEKIIDRIKRFFRK